MLKTKDGKTCWDINVAKIVNRTVLNFVNVNDGTVKTSNAQIITQLDHFNRILKPALAQKKNQSQITACEKQLAKIVTAHS